VDGITGLQDKKVKKPAVLPDPILFILLILSNAFAFDFEVVSAGARATLEWKVLKILGGRSLESEW